MLNESSSYNNNNSMVEILPFAINQKILSHFKVKQRALLAITCNDFYQMHINLTKSDYNSPELSVYVDESFSFIPSFWCRHTRIRFQTFQRCLQCNRKIHFSVIHGKHAPSTITVDKFFMQCKQLISKVLLIDCSDNIADC